MTDRTSISASRSAALLAGLSFLLGRPPRPRRGRPPVLSITQCQHRKRDGSLGKRGTDLGAGSTGVAGATREAREAGGGGRDGSTTISIFIGRSV